jgi:hypothetical protein
MTHAEMLRKLIEIRKIEIDDMYKKLVILLSDLQKQVLIEQSHDCDE